MNLLHNNKLQKASAAFLLAVLMCINAVKAFHTHDPSLYVKTEKSSHASTTIKTFFSCSICDFQFAKDSDAQTASINVDVSVKFVDHFFRYYSSPLFSTSAEFSVRGPPSIM